MHDHVRRHLEASLGFSIESFPAIGVVVRASPKRTDSPGNRLLVHRIANQNGALATVVPRLLDTIAPAIGEMSSTELFSPLGIAELRRALSPEDRVGLLEEPGLDYTISGPQHFRSASTPHRSLPLMKKDIPAAREDFRLRMSQRDESPPENLVWAFVCCHGRKRVAIAVIRWEEGLIGTISIAGTKERYRRQGYGRAVVSAATEYILRQGRVPIYGTVRSNVPALRMIRPLGFRLAYETIWA